VLCASKVIIKPNHYHSGTLFKGQMFENKPKLDYHGSMVPKGADPERKDTRIALTIHKISWDDKIKFNALRISLNKTEYELFHDMVDLYWRNLDLEVSPQQKTVLSRKFIDMIYRITESKSPRY
jgi:hypothetical protein